MKFIKIILISFLLVSSVYGLSAFDIKWGTDLISNQRSNTLKQWAESVEGRLGGVTKPPTVGTGNIFYVDSNVTTEGDGTSWADARNTLDEAIGLCTDNNGDVIFVAQGHAEDWTTTDSVDVDVIGVTIIGCGTGSNAPTFTYDDTDPELVLGAANCYIYNLRFLPSVTAVVHAIEIEADADGSVIDSCWFMDGEASGTDEFIDAIQPAALADDITVMNCRFESWGGAGANTGIDLTAGVHSDWKITGNYFKGDYAEAPIYNDNDIDLRILVNGNTAANDNAGQYAIEFGGAATGVIVGNVVYTNSLSTAIDPGSCSCFENYAINTVDLSAARIPANTLDAILTDLAGISQLGDKVVADMDANSILADLQGISQLGDKVVADMDANSLLVNLTAARAGYLDNINNALLTELGLSEIGDKVVADMDANSTIVSLTTNNLDHLAKTAVANGDDLTAEITDGTIWSNFLTKTGDTSDYTRATMSVEALATVLNDLAGISQIGDKVQADMDANSLLVNLTAARAGYLDNINNALLTELGLSEIGDKVQVDMDANSLLVNLTAARAGYLDNINNALLLEIGLSEIGDKVQVDMDANSTSLAAIKAVTDDLAGISQVGDKVQADMDANSVLFWQPRSIQASTDEITGNLFTVTGGPIEILSFWGYVDVQIGAGAATCKIWIDTTAGAAYDQDFSTAVNIEADAVGTMYIFSAANPAVLTPLTPGSEGAGNPMYPWICPAGTIEQLMSGDPGGAGGDHITWTMVYRPLKAGVTVADAS